MLLSSDLTTDEMYEMTLSYLEGAATLHRMICSCELSPRAKAIFVLLHDYGASDYLDGRAPLCCPAVPIHEFTEFGFGSATSVLAATRELERNRLIAIEPGRVGCPKRYHLGYCAKCAKASDLLPLEPKAPISLIG
jgi:hypothetical protein